jgi:hypothetical protein
MSEDGLLGLAHVPSVDSQQVFPQLNEQVRAEGWGRVRGGEEGGQALLVGFQCCEGVRQRLSLATPPPPLPACAISGWPAGLSATRQHDEKVTADGWCRMGPLRG